MRVALALLVVTLFTGACDEGTGTKPGAGSASGPPGDCARAAENLAAFTLGNYAPADQRAPAIAKAKAACEAAKPSATEVACLEKAVDRWNAAKCVPRMYPDIDTKADDCKVVVERIRQSVAPQLSQTGSAGIEQLNKIMPIMEQACIEDRWPAEVKGCIIATTPGDMKALETCSEKLPKDLQETLNARMSKML